MGSASQQYDQIWSSGGARRDISRTEASSPATSPLSGSCSWPGPMIPCLHTQYSHTRTKQRKALGEFSVIVKLHEGSLTALI